MLRFDLRRHGIGVSLVCPGGVATPLTETVHIAGIDRTSPAFRRAHARFRKRAVTPEQAAEAIWHGVRRNRYWVYTSPDIRAVHLLQRYAPWAYARCHARHERGRQPVAARGGARPTFGGAVTSRIGPAGAGPLVRAFAGLAGRVTGTEPPAVFLTLGRHPRLFWGWLLFAGSLMPGGRLARRETELVILRVATLTGSDYELTQHRPPGPPGRPLGGRGRAGGRRAAMARVGRRATGCCCGSPTSFTRDEDLSDETWAALRAAYDEARCLEVVMLVGHYRMLATTLTTLRVQPDRPRRRGRR